MSNATAVNSVLRASAGTGKTFQLTNRLLGLCCAGAAPEEMLATTFTRKAAAEILDRALTRLAAAARDPAQCATLAAQTGAADLTPSRALNLLVSLLRHLDRLRIMTLDSFFAQVAGRFALELGLPPGWSIADELTDAHLRSEAIEAVLADTGDGQVEQLLGLMTKGEAQRGVSQLLRDAVKDLYDVYRETRSDAWRWLPKPPLLAADELSATLAELSEATLPDDKRFATARDRDVRLAQVEDWETLLAAGLCSKVLAGESRYYAKPIPVPVVGLYTKLLRHVRAVELRRLAYQTEATADLLARFDREYQRLKRRRRLVRFEDVTAAVVGGAGLTGDGGIAWRLDADVAHLLLDEFQDTSLVQWQALWPLAQRAAGSPARSFFCVGDVKQAIYGWRGGVAEIFDALTVQLPQLKCDSLSTSYRSAPAVIEAVNEIFTSRMHAQHGNLDDLEPAVAEWCGTFPPHTTAKSKLAGHVALQTAPAATDADVDPSVATLRYAAKCVARLAPLIEPRTIGVLLRTNQSVARMIYELRKLEIDASEEGGNPLTDSAAVGTVLSLLRLADHPGDTVAAYHVARSPLGDVVGLVGECDGRTVCELARRVRRELATDGYGRTVRRWTEGLSGSCSQRDLDRLRQLTEMACDYDAESTLRADSFVELVEETRVPRSATAQVRVMTVHQAKGLEFDAVVLAELDVKLVGQPPAFVAGRPAPGEPIDRVCLYRGEHVRSLLPDEARRLFEQNTRQRISEALSLLYVMVTRPIHALYMIVEPTAETKQPKLHKTFAGLLRAALTDGERLLPLQTVYERGDAQWYLHSGDDPPRGVASQSVVPPLEPLAVRLAPARPGARSRLVAQSPSQLEGGPRRPAVDSLRTDGAAARRRGRLLHAWFELIEWLDGVAPEGGEPDDDILRRVAARCDVEEHWLASSQRHHEQCSELIAEFRAMLARPAIAAALRCDAYRSPLTRELPPAVVVDLAAGATQLVIRRERPIVARDGDRLLSGQIDRLVLVLRGGKLLWADVIDFKTDRLAAGDAAALAAKVEFYRPQIDAYRRAVAQMYHVTADRVTAQLLFVEPGVVAEV